MSRTKGMSLAKGPVGIIGAVLLAGGILGLLFGSTDFTTHAPDGEPEIDDQPLGPPADLDEDDAPLPGLPESEPPQAD